MDDAGIDVAVVSLSTPGVHTGDSVKARALARRCNEFSAEPVLSRPDRFAGFARPPLARVISELENVAQPLRLSILAFALHSKLRRLARQKRIQSSTN